MKNNLSELVFILDRSGSMSGLEGDTIGGYNSFIQKQKQEKGEAVLTTVLFDDQYEVLHNRQDIRKIQPLTTKDYFVRGSTALLDAIGKTIIAIGQKLEGILEEERPSKVVFIITTDGMENASTEYSAEKIRNMIEHQKVKYSWEFIFMGANIDAIRAAKNIGIEEDRAVQYCCDREGVELNYEVISDAISGIRKNKVIDKKWKAEIEKDFQNRGKR